MNTAEARGINQNLTPGALGATGTNATINLAGNPTQIVVGGRHGSVAQSATEAVPATDAVSGAAFLALGASQACVFAIMANVDGDVAVAQGPIEDLTADGDAACRLPPIPNDHALIGYTTVKTTSAVTSWTIGSDNWDATGVTSVNVNVNTPPTRPVIV